MTTDLNESRKEGRSYWAADLTDRPVERAFPIASFECRNITNKGNSATLSLLKLKQPFSLNID